jgi:hypothetical protein
LKRKQKLMKTSLAGLELHRRLHLTRASRRLQKNTATAALALSRYAGEGS